MAHHRRVAAAGGQGDGVHRLGERADLVDLDQERVGRALPDAAGEPLGVGDEEVVADELDLVAELRGQLLPAGPVVLVERVLDGHERIGVDELAVVGRHVLGGLLLALEGVGAVVAELAGGDVERERDLGAGLVAGLLDRGDDQVERLAVALEVGREATLVTEAGRQALVLEHGLERVVDLGAPAQRLAEGGRADRGDHEFLDVDVGVRVGAAVEDVHHRHGQHVGVGAADVAEERQAGGLGSGLGHGERDAEDRVGADGALVVRPVDGEHLAVDEALLAGVEADETRGQVILDRADGVLDTLAQVAVLVAVTALDGLEGAGRRTARHRGAGDGSVVEGDLDLDGRVAAGVEDLAGANCFDAGHCRLLGGARYTGRVATSVTARPRRFVLRPAPRTRAKGGQPAASRSASRRCWTPSTKLAGSSHASCAARTRGQSSTVMANHAVSRDLPFVTTCRRKVPS